MHGHSSVDVGLILLLLLVVAVVAAAVRFVRVPYTVALVVAGLALALTPGTPRVELTPDVILLVFLPVLLFEAAYRLDVEALRANLRPILLLALPGVLVTAVLVGGALALLAGLRWETALLFGAMVAATDPVAVLALFRELGAPKRLATIVEGESLFNDGTALVVFRGVVAAIVAGAFSPAAALTNFVVVAAGGLIVGAAVGALASQVLIRIDDALLETTITLIVAYGSYLLAEQLGVSGVLAVVVAGLIVGHEAHTTMQPSTRLTVAFVWEFLGFVANSLLFLLVGLELRPVEEHVGLAGALGLLWPLAVAVGAMLAVRALVIAGSTLILARIDRPLPWSWLPVLTWGGLRGALSLAMVLSLPAVLNDGTPFPDRDRLLLLTFGVMLFTLLVQALTMRPLLLRTGLGAPDRHTDYERALGRLRANRAALRELDALVTRGRLSPELANRWRGPLMTYNEALSAQIEALRATDVKLEVEHTRQIRRHLLHVERLELAHLREAGDISDDVWRELVAEIDAELDAVEHGDPATVAVNTPPTTQ